MRDPRYDVLFEPVQLGPVTARNRFFQVPHCNGMGHRDPTAHAVMRGVKAEGGWAVVCTEEVDFHPDSDTGGYVEGRLWDDADIPMHERLVDQVHAHDSLAGIEFVHNGMASANLYGRIPPAGPSHLPVKEYAPIQARRDDARGHRRPAPPSSAAVRRALTAGYDLVYVYAAHNLSTLQHFLSPWSNLRDDDYGGALANRARLLREVLEDTREECDGRAAVACRIVVDELHGADGIQRGDMDALFELIGELPDVWDVMVGVWEDDSLPSRFGYEAWTEEHFRGIKSADVEAGRRDRLADVAGHDGAARPRRRARPDRCGAAVDRRPVPAGEDRGGPARGHPRVHRLQRLRHRRLDDDADPLHPEPVDGRGVAARLAPRAVPPARLGRRRCSSSAAARPGSRRRWRSGSAATR